MDLPRRDPPFIAAVSPGDDEEVQLVVSAFAGSAGPLAFAGEHLGSPSGARA